MFEFGLIEEAVPAASDAPEAGSVGVPNTEKVFNLDLVAIKAGIRDGLKDAF